MFIVCLAITLTIFIKTRKLNAIILSHELKFFKLFAKKSNKIPYLQKNFFLSLFAEHRIPIPNPQKSEAPQQEIKTTRRTSTRPTPR